MDAADVPAGPLALDTDVFSFFHYKKGPHRGFSRLIDGHALALPFPVVGELKVLAIRAGHQRRRREDLGAAITACVVIPYDARVVDAWAELQARFLERSGINDLWIAACCLVYGLPLVTNNLNDFRLVAGEFPALELVHPNL